ncbi:MAG: 50S ribosomal protein P1 [Halobacteria archaeon]|nr:50S ribosomal protein P1 [Halobacteria archaeon]
MEYLYAALLLHNAGSEVNEENVTDVLESAGVDADESRVKSLVAALEDVDIDEAVEQAAAAPAAGAGGGSSGGAEASAGGEEADDEAEEPEEESDEPEPDVDEEEAEEDASEGLGELFG